MKHYIDKVTKEVFAYESDGSQDKIIKKRLVLISGAALADAIGPTAGQLLLQLSSARKSQEQQGVTVNDIRYAGDPGNRQALQEAISFMDNAGLTEFPKWKDSDNQFHAGHLLSDVVDAYQAIGERRRP